MQEFLNDALGSDLKSLDNLSPLARVDEPFVRAFFPKESIKHTGRMRVALVRELIQRYGGSKLDTLIVADPMTGTGSTGVAAVLEGCAGFIGCELVGHWAEISRQAIGAARGEREFFMQIRNGDASDVVPPSPFHLLITSPPFPNSHSQGKSEMQSVLRSSKATHAGNDFECNQSWGVGSSPKRQLWVRELSRVLDPWISCAAEGAWVLIHVKNFVKMGKIVRVDQWARDALTGLSVKDLEVIGSHSVPLNYRSGFQEWRRYPRKVVVERSRRGKIFIEKLSCGHIKERRDNGAHHLPKNAVCTSCGPIPGLVEVREERIVVARRKN